MIFAQDGHGPAQKIDEGMAHGYIDGAILSIKTRSTETLAQTISLLRGSHTDKELFVDTHFYASQMSMTSPGKIPDYNLYDIGLTRKDFSARGVTNFARRLVDFQRGLGLTNIIVPGLTMANFDDASSLLCMQLYTASLEYMADLGGGLKAYIPIVMHESALRDNEKLSQFLDEVTLLENVSGFYIVVERERTTFINWQDSRTLAKLMYMVNTLSQSWEVICGFVGFPGQPLLAAGATHVASGWHQTLRQYTGSYFMRTRGRANGTFRYASKELLTELISAPDLQAIVRSGHGDEFIDPTYGDDRLDDPDNLLFPPAIQILHQWKTYQDLGNELLAADEPVQKLKELVDEAQGHVGALRSYGVVLDPTATGHYDTWKQAIEAYQSGVL